MASVTFSHPPIPESFLDLTIEDEERINQRLPDILQKILRRHRVCVTRQYASKEGKTAFPHVLPMTLRSSSMTIEYRLPREDEIGTLTWSYDGGVLRPSRTSWCSRRPPPVPIVTLPVDLSHTDYIINDNGSTPYAAVVARTENEEIWQFLVISAADFLEELEGKVEF